MTDRQMAPGLDPTQECLAILAGELELAIRWQRPCVLLAVYGSDYIRAQAEAALESHLLDLGQQTTRVRIGQRQAGDIVGFLREFRDPTRTVFFLDGLSWLPEQERSLNRSLNFQREFFIERQVRVTVWLTQNELVDLARHAPDFWAFRHGVIDFIESTPAEQVLQGLLESAWQAGAESTQHAEHSAAKASVPEPLSTGAGQGDEASTARANLLLTLGLLNWRKGDFAQADELLRAALQLAGRIPGSGFQAECFNAIALVKTSLDRIDEAIDAYKQAIHLGGDQIFAWNNLGNLCEKIGRNDEAIITFLKAIECNPQDPIGWNGLGNVYHKNGYTQDAIEAYRRAIQFLPTFAHPWNGLGDVYAGLGRVAEAMQSYRKAIELNNRYMTPWLRLGMLMAKHERHRDAIQAYQRALKLDAGSSEIWNELGKSQLACQAYEEAAQAFTRAIALDPADGQAHSNLALSRAQLGRPKEAIPLYLKSIDLLAQDKDKAVAWNRLADAYRLLNDYDNAIAAYQIADGLDHRPLTTASAAAAADTNPPAPETAEELQPAEAQQSAEQSGPVLTPQPEIPDAPYWIFNPKPYGDVEDSFKPAEEESSHGAPADGFQEPGGAAMPLSMPATHPTSPGTAEASLDGLNAQAWNEKGNLHFKRGAFDEAIQAYNKAIQLDPTLGWPYSNLALTYLTQGQYAEAILLYQKSIDLLSSQADRAVSWNGLGNVYRCINDYDNAVAAYQKAAELDPETAGMRDGADTFQAGQGVRNAQVWNDLGELFSKTGAYSEAIKSFHRAIEMEPQSGWAYSNLGHVLAAQGRYAEALPLYQKSITLLPDDKDKAVAWNRLGNVYRKLNDYDNAVKAYQQAVILADEGVSLLTRTRFSLLSNCRVDQ